MNLDDSLDDLERALAALRQVRDDTTEWSDDVRTRFDDQRLTPLDEAGIQLIAAIKRAQDGFGNAERLVAD